MGFLNPEGYFVTSPQKLEDADGVKERIDPEMQEIFNTIYRGPVSVLLLLCLNFAINK